MKFMRLIEIYVIQFCTLLFFLERKNNKLDKFLNFGIKIYYKDYYTNEESKI